MLDIAMVGDPVLDEPDPDHWLSGIASALQGCQLAIAHLEVPHTASRIQSATSTPVGPLRARASTAPFISAC